MNPASIATGQALQTEKGQLQASKDALANNDPVYVRIFQEDGTEIPFASQPLVTTGVSGGGDSGDTAFDTLVNTFVTGLASAIDTRISDIDTDMAALDCMA